MLRASDSRLAPVLLASTPSSWEGRPVVIVVAHDLGAHRRREAVARQAHAMAALARVLGSLAHDVNNFLSVILSYSDFVLADLDPAHPSLKDVEEIKGSGRRTAELMQKIMAFSKRGGASLGSVDVDAKIPELLPKLRAGLPEKVTLETRFGGPPGAKCEVAALELAIGALVQNAKEAMPNGGRITLATRSAEVDANDAAEHVGAVSGSFVVVSVEDEGPGMTPEVQARALEPFFSTKPKARGIGLGLSAVFGFAAVSGGHVRIETRPVGAVVSIWLPRA